MAELVRKCAECRQEKPVDLTKNHGWLCPECITHTWDQYGRKVKADGPNKVA